MHDDQVKAALDGATNLTPPTSKCPKQEPFMLALVKALFGKLDPKVTLNVSVRACLTCSFFTLVWAGKFTIPSLNSFNPTVHIKHSDIWMAMDHHGYHIMVFHLPCMKCFKEGKDMYCSAQPGVINSISELENHLAIIVFCIQPFPRHFFTFKHTSSLKCYISLIF